MRSELVWLGQASFLIQTDETAILIDPYAADHPLRLHPPPDLLVTCACDAVLITHEHVDHLDDELLATLARRSEQARLVVPSPLLERVALVFPTSRTVGVQPGDALDIGGARIEVVASYHALSPGEPFSDGSKRGGSARFVGYIIGSSSLPTIYHSGDTIATPELVEALQGRGIEIALLPINGRDYFRERNGIVGNLSSREAVALAAAIAAPIVVPMHWDLFDGNTERPGTAADAASESGQPVHVLSLARGVPLPLAFLGSPAAKGAAEAP